MAEDTVYKKGTLVWCRRPGFSYDGYVPVQGEIIELKQLANDGKIVRLGYFVVVPEPKKADTYVHGATGRRFIDARYLENFGRAQAREQAERLQVRQSHNPLGAPYGVVDTTGDAEERRMEQEHPLYWDQTKASRQ